MDAMSDSPQGAAIDAEGILIAALVLVLVVAFVWLMAIIRRYVLVAGASSALQELAVLNATYQPLIRKQPQMRLAYVESVNSKAKFDRFDLNSFMIRSVMENERWFESEILSRWVTVEQHNAYEWEFESAGSQLLGRSAHRLLRQEHFAKTESRMFRRRKLARPTPAARVRATVTYRSPGGQNSYSKYLEWNFDQLRAGLYRGQELRTQQSTAHFLRQREREKMTAGLRMQVLRRDDFRCRMCGASGREGAQLHVDHIRPVSRGGLTVHDNLQALCVPCNLGKSNHFVG